MAARRTATDAIPSLKQFMLKQDVRRLYRNIFRAIHKLEDKYYQDFFRKSAREQFKMHTHEKDEKEIRVLLAQGTQQLRDYQRSLKLAS